MALAKVAVAGVNFGDLDMYVAGGAVPEGDYIITDMTVKMHQATDSTTGANKGAARLGVMVTYLPLSDPHPGKELKPVFYSMGGKADQVFQPNPETGKGVVVVPGATGNTLNNQTNWAFFLKSLYDCGLPKGIFQNDTTVLEGTHVHVAPVPEPEDRKNISGGAATGEAGGTEVRRPGTIAIITEIKDDGKPWEGSGGIPTAGKKPTKAAAKPAAKAAPVATIEEVADEDLQNKAMSAIADVLEKNPNGMLKLALTNSVFKSIGASEGEAVANAVMAQILKNDDAYNAVLGTIGYGIVGKDVKPA